VGLAAPHRTRSICYEMLHMYRPLGTNLTSALREQHRLRVLENRVLKRISGPRQEEAAGDRQTA